MLCAGCTWAFIIGNACSVFANMDHHGSAWRTDMDELNYFMEDMEIDEALRVRVRMYFLKGRDLQRHRDYITLVAKMSPGLKGEVSQQLNKHNLNAIWFLKKVASRTAGCYMAEAFTHAMFPPWEWVKEDALHVIETGMVLCNGIPKRRGKIWGYDIILDCQDLRRDQAVRSLTYTEVNYVNKEALQLTCEQHPEVRTTPLSSTVSHTFFCRTTLSLALTFVRTQHLLTYAIKHTHIHTPLPHSQIAYQVRRAVIQLAFARGVIRLAKIVTIMRNRKNGLPDEAKHGDQPLTALEKSMTSVRGKQGSKSFIRSNTGMPHAVETSSSSIYNGINSTSTRRFVFSQQGKAIRLGEGSGMIVGNTEDSWLPEALTKKERKSLRNLFVNDRQVSMDEHMEEKRMSHGRLKSFKSAPGMRTPRGSEISFHDNEADLAGVKEENHGPQAAMVEAGKEKKEEEIDAVKPRSFAVKRLAVVPNAGTEESQNRRSFPNAPNVANKIPDEFADSFADDDTSEEEEESPVNLDAGQLAILTKMVQQQGDLAEKVAKIDDTLESMQVWMKRMSKKTGAMNASQDIHI